MIRLQTALALGAALAVASCATGYGPNTLGGGYKDEKLDDTHYRVKFDGNGYASKDRVWNFWIYRCAELTKEKGFTHFTIQKPGEPLSLAPQGPRIRPIGYREGGDEAPRMIKTRSGGVTYIPVYVPGHTITTWHSDAVVAMFKEPLPEGVWLLRAQSVLDDLAPYIKSNGASTPPLRDDIFRHAATFNRLETNYNFGGPL